MGGGETDSGSKSKPESAGEDTDTDDAVESGDESATEFASVEPADPHECPASELDETVHKVLYVLEAVVDEFDNIITYGVEHELTCDHGLRDVMRSELHNTVFTVATGHLEEIVERVLKQHGVDDGDPE